MKEMFKEAESLYWQIDKVIWNLIATRENNDEEGKKSAISEMETAMCNAMQLLKCFIERKGNIVDLAEVWHSAEKEPTHGDKFLCDDKCLGWSVRAWDGMLPWSEHVKLYGLTKWAYLDDLLQKGGE